MRLVPRGESGLLRNTTLALLATLGGNAVAPAVSVAASKCNVAAQVDQLERHVRDDDQFAWPAVASSNSKGFVLMYDKHRELAKQPVYNPLVIRCFGKTIRYVGITLDADETLGQRHDVGSETHMYLDVVKPSQVAVSKYYMKGHMVLEHPQLKEAIIHPLVPETNVPAFVEQPGDNVLENSFGVMTNGL